MALSTPCPLRCPAGWRQIPNTGTDHCYLWPPKPVPVMDFWSYENYCKSFQPTSYIVCVNSQQEYQAGATQAIAYLLTYVVGTFYVWLGAYYNNGNWTWLDGSPWNYNNMYISQMSSNIGNFIPAITLPPPKDGDCIYVDPKSTGGSWYYRPCSDQQGATVCEMSPLPDCSGTTLAPTTTAPYQSPTCNEAKMADFLRQSQAGYYGVQEMMTLSNMDTNSCAVACMYYSGCISFDISTTGDCRLLDQSLIILCQSVTPDDTYQHYDMMFL